MNQPIEGLRPETEKVDLRTREGRQLRASMRAEEPHAVHSGQRDMRPDSVREAEELAAQLMESGVLNQFGNELDIPADLAPEGWEYQLKATEIAGKDNTHHMLGLQRNGWRPVPASRHRHLMPEGYEGPILMKGLMLMELPKVLCDRARKLERQEALDLKANADAKLFEAPPNTGPRQTKSAHHQSINSVEHEFYSPAAPS